MSSWREQIARDYEQALTRLVAYAKRAEVNAPFSVYAAIEELRNRFNEAEEWTDKEIDELVDDLEAADAHLRDAGRGILDWLRIDARLIEEKLVSSLTDDTKLAWLKLRRAAQVRKPKE